MLFVVLIKFNFRQAQSILRGRLPTKFTSYNEISLTRLRGWMDGYAVQLEGNSVIVVENVAFIFSFTRLLGN